MPLDVDIAAQDRMYVHLDAGHGIRQNFGAFAGRILSKGVGLIPEDSYQI